MNNLKRIFLFLLLFTFNSNLLSQSENDQALSSDQISIGQQLFKSNCVSCHTIGDGDLVGPDLMGVTEKRSKEWLMSWITDNKALRESGDKEAIAIYEQYNKQSMQAFYFSEDEMNDLLAYLENPPVEQKDEVIAQNDLSDEGISLTLILMIAALILLMFIFILTSVKNSLKEALSQPTHSVFDSVQYFLSVDVNKAIIGAAVFLIITRFFIFEPLMGIGIVEEYQPAQPIEFSHKIHAGENGIDCNYCHSSARHGKMAGVPSVNVCMNCHTMIKKGTHTGEFEINKIHEAFENNQPIEWVRVHQLPDLSYFNHSQHVNVAGLECQQCHGNMEEKTLGQVATMEELNAQKFNKDQGIEFKHPTLSMGWCIDCHRQKEVDVEGNDYYLEMHEQLKNKHGEKKITVDMIGGMECGKCHY